MIYSAYIIVTHWNQVTLKVTVVLSVSQHSVFLGQKVNNFKIELYK